MEIGNIQQMEKNMKNKSARIPMGLRIVLMSILMVFVAVQQASAVERIGTIVAKTRSELQRRITVFVDTIWR